MEELHCSGKAKRDMCIECRRAYDADNARAYRARKRGATKGVRSVDILAVDGRTLVRVGRHTIGAMPRSRELLAECAAAFTPGYALGDVPVIFARVPRSESPRSRDVARDRAWRTDSIAGDVHECSHGGHEPTHSHGAPLLPQRFVVALDVALAFTLGHDAEWAAARSVIGECAALLVPGYAPLALLGEAWRVEREAHVNGTWVYATDDDGRTVRVRDRERCPECAAGELQTTWTNSAPDVRAPMPPTAATRAADRRLARTTVTTAAERVANDWARVVALTLADRRAAEREAWASA